MSDSFSSRTASCPTLGVSKTQTHIRLNKNGSSLRGLTLMSCSSIALRSKMAKTSIKLSAVLAPNEKLNDLCSSPNIVRVKNREE